MLLMPLTLPMLAAATRATVPPRCVYSAHPGTTYLGGGHRNVIECRDAEGLQHCQQRCDGDVHCSGFGLYVNGSSIGRCCTKSNNLGPARWVAGVSYLKEVKPPQCPLVPAPPSPPTPAPQPVPPAPPSAHVEVSVIFRGNASFGYNKGAMIEQLPDGRIAAAAQAGAKEGSPDQRILFTISDDKQQFDAERGWVETAPEAVSRGLSQWEPTLFLAPNRTLWLFFSQGVPPQDGSFDLFAQTTDASSGFRRWSAPRMIYNTSTAAAPPRKLMWPINRIVLTPDRRQDWLLPCDWGCAPPTAAFTMRSSDAGSSWHPDAPIPGTELPSNCPEPALAVVNSTTLFAMVRNTHPGFLQSWSHDMGRTWTAAIPSSAHGASSKMALLSLRDTQRRVGAGAEPASAATLVLAWSVYSRERMALSTSTDGGISWHYFATLDNGSATAPPESSDCYPTVLQAGDSLLTAWSTYDGGPRDDSAGEVEKGVGGGDGRANIKLARTALPTFSHHV
eukprot:COSAG01_NODE_1064_length_11885_cov_7.744358_7_plen_505_part_00